MKGQSEWQGFTLIELSIVLVVIGLVVGGVLVGGDMIRSAGERSTITQIEKYQTAVNVFRGKYNALPGDMNAATAAQFGFVTRSGTPGTGDGNGVLQAYNGVSVVGYSIGGGETGVFWNDLSAANLIDANLVAAASYGLGFGITSSSSPNIDAYLPKAKIGAGNYLYTFSIQNNNYFGLSGVTCLCGGAGLTTNPALTVRQAYDIDQKVDDGFPQTGRLTAQYSTMYGIIWAGSANTSATPGSSTTCYDNGNVTSAVQQYSITQNNGAGMNCALSFQFQ